MVATKTPSTLSIYVQGKSKHLLTREKCSGAANEAPSSRVTSLSSSLNDLV